MTGSDLPRVTTVDTSDQDHDNIQSVRIDEDSVTGDVTATTTRIIRGDDGTTSKITTTEKFNKGKFVCKYIRFTYISVNMNLYLLGDQFVEKTLGRATLKKLSDTKISQGTLTSEKDEEESNVNKDNLEDILKVLKPFNEMLLSEELANPDLFDELFSIDFSDLVKVFHHLLSESDSIEETYNKMILGAKRLGVQKFAEEVLKSASEENNDNFRHLSLETITKYIASYKGSYQVSSILIFSLI